MDLDQYQASIPLFCLATVLWRSPGPGNGSERSTRFSFIVSSGHV
jgi:hypothetical protein